MRTSTSPKLPEKSHATPLESVRFRDGMIVTSDDLETAVQYPVSMFQTLVRAYFGCGIVCGLQLGADPRSAAPGAGNSQAGGNVENGGTTSSGAGCGPPPSYVICIQPGVALDCHGYPLELCGPVKFDLTPGPCEPRPEELCIAIRRITSDEAPRETCGCTCETEDRHLQCSRVRDHVLIKAFPPDELEELRNLCSRHDVANGDESPVDLLCECLESCPSCDCCGDAWVLLGCVRLTDDGIEIVTRARRKYVKPTACVCAIAPEIQELRQAVSEIRQEIRDRHDDD